MGWEYNQAQELYLHSFAVSSEMDAVPRTNGFRSPIVAAVASAKRSLVRFLRSDPKAYA